MVHKMKPEFMLFLAEEALKKKYAEKESSIREIMEIQESCRDYLPVENSRRIYAKVMKKEIMRIMVEVVYHSLSAEEQKLVELKYKKKKQLVSISMTMNVSVAQLMIWQHNILEKISMFMLYRLSIEDIFERKKIINMIELLSKILEFAESYDPKCEFVMKSWVQAISDRHDRYVELLSEIDDVLRTEEESLYNEIVATKIYNPHETTRELAKMCHTDKGIVSRYLNQFSEKVKAYVD